MRQEEVVLFHSALGLRPVVHDVADRLRAEGHSVHTPDSFDGEVFESIEDGTRRRDEIGIPELMRRAMAAVADLPPELVFAGFSMGRCRTPGWDAAWRTRSDPDARCARPRRHRSRDVAARSRPDPLRRGRPIGGPNGRARTGDGGTGLGRRGGGACLRSGRSSLRGSFVGRPRRSRRRPDAGTRPGVPPRTPNGVAMTYQIDRRTMIGA